MRTSVRIGVRKCGSRGGALLAVLWLVAALSAIALTIAATVRGEIERTTIRTEGLQAYYLARGSIDRAALYLQWGTGGQRPGEPPRYFGPGMRGLVFQYPAGQVQVDVIPEASKLNINAVSGEELVRLLIAVGADPMAAPSIAEAIVHWREPAREMNSALDTFYLGRIPSFPARHSSLENVEELLLVRGMTPELFYGSYVPGEGDSLVWRGGLRDCVSVFGSVREIDVNWAEPAVLAALGFPLSVVQAIVARREVQPFVDRNDLNQLGLFSYPAGGRLRVGGRSQFTLRATAVLRQQDGSLSNVRRTVAATVDISDVSGDRPFTTMRWYDTAWKQ